MRFVRSSIIGGGIPFAFSSVAAGASAALCMVGDKDPGQVTSMLAVAGRNHVVQVQCVHDADTQENAEGDWAYYWINDVTHVQQSLHLPKSEN